MHINVFDVTNENEIQWSIQSIMFLQHNGTRQRTQISINNNEILKMFYCILFGFESIDLE